MGREGVALKRPYSFRQAAPQAETVGTKPAPPRQAAPQPGHGRLEAAGLYLTLSYHGPCQAALFLQASAHTALSRPYHASLPGVGGTHPGHRLAQLPSLKATEQVRGGKQDLRPRQLPTKPCFYPGQR